MQPLRLNPSIDVRAAAEAYAADSFVRIEGLFDEETAHALRATIQSLPWRLVCQNDQGQNLLLGPSELRAMPPQALSALKAGIAQRAAANIGYAYFAYPMIEAAVSGWDPGHPIHALTTFLNSAPFLEFARALIRCPGLTKIDAHASNYSPGHFLTRHVDDGDRKERRAAYTITFTPDWQADWGGLLMFLDDNNDITRGYVPHFNALTVFDGLRVHSVSCVAPFAPQPRLSVAGWFRDDPVRPA